MADKNESKTPLAEEIDFVGAGLQNLQHLDAVADHMSDIAGYLKELAETATLKAIMEYGSATDKEKALEQLKSNSGYNFD